MSRNGCWTCKDRKIRCDRALPVCRKCIQSKKKCGGYELRLVWPSAHGSKRFVCHKVPSEIAKVTKIEEFAWVNVNFQDIKVHNRLSGLLHFQEIFIQPYPSVSIASSPSWRPSVFGTEESDLLEYFEYMLPHTITICLDDNNDLVESLVRLSFSDSSDSSKAVLHSILAIASLSRRGLQVESLRYFGKALGALRSSANRGISISETMQHVATNLLLCVFEIAGSSQCSETWLGYLSNARKLLGDREIRLEELPSESLAVITWFHYYDLMGQFTRRRWQSGRNPATKSSDIEGHIGAVSRIEPFERVSSSLFPLWILRLGTEIFEYVLPPSHMYHHSKEYQDHVSFLKLELQKLSSYLQSCESPPDRVLFPLVSLIYLERVSTDFSGFSDTIEQWTESAFQILDKAGNCKYPFLMLVLGMEARTDDRRMIMLRVIHETSKTMNPRNTDLLLHVLHAAWNQDDLMIDQDLDYTNKLNMIFSSYKYVPAFI